MGADVPVFVRGHSAFAEGVGERLQAIDIAGSVLGSKADCEVSTAEIFSHKQLTRNTSPITIAAVLKQGGHNDCEAVVRQCYPAVDWALNWLNSLDQTATNNPARLTGTGACVFAQYPDRKSAEQTLHQLPMELQGFIAKGVNISPTHQALSLNQVLIGASPSSKAPGFDPTLEVRSSRPSHIVFARPNYPSEAGLKIDTLSTQDWNRYRFDKMRHFGQSQQPAISCRPSSVKKRKVCAVNSFGLSQQQFATSIGK